MAPGGRPHRFDDGVDLARQAGSGLECGVGAELQCLGTLGFATRGDEHLQPRRVGQLDRRGGHTTARALDEDRVAGLDVRGREHQRVGGQPARTEGGRLVHRQVRGLGEHVRAGHRGLLSHRARIVLGQDRAALPRHDAVAIIAHKRVQHHLAAGLEPVPAGDVLIEDAGGVGAEDHRGLGFCQSHALEAPQVVMVDGRRLHGHRGPVRARLRLRHVADVQHGQRIIMVDSCGDYGPHRHSL